MKDLAYWQEKIDELEVLIVCEDDPYWKGVYYRAYIIAQKQYIRLERELIYTLN